MSISLSDQQALETAWETFYLFATESRASRWSPRLRFITGWLPVAVYIESRSLWGEFA